MSDAPRRLPPKKEVALALLQGPSLFVHLDPRKSGVVVPKWLTGQPQLVLQVGLNMAIQIPDLTVDEEGVCCTLSFNRTPFWCQLPWSAVYALVGEDGRGMIWPNDVPPEVALQMQKGAPGAPAPIAPKAAPPAKKARKLSPVADAEAPKSPRSRSRAEPKPDEVSAVTSTKPAPSDADRERTRPRRIPVPVLASAEAELPDGEETSEAKTSASRPENGAARKPKRELPPYLRIVK